MSNTSVQKSNMLVNLLKPAGISDTVIGWIQQAPWELCCQDSPYQHLNYADYGMPIDGQRASYTPIEMGQLLDALQLKSTDTVLEIGSSGMRLTTILAKVCCSVMTVEMIRAVHDRDAALCTQLDLRNVQCSMGDATTGWGETTYSVVLINGAVPYVNKGLLDAVATPGRLFMALGASRLKRGTLMAHHADDSWHTQHIFETEQTLIPSTHYTPSFKF